MKIDGFWIPVFPDRYWRLVSLTRFVQPRPRAEVGV